jgi:simple sugar transport system permease protein
VICVLVGIGAWVLVNRTAFGVLSSLAGRNPIMVVWQGARLSRLGLAGFVIGGSLAGLAGTIEVLGPIGRLSSGMLPTHGFTAILIALVANLSVLATAFVAIFFGGLAAAGLYLPVLAAGGGDRHHQRRDRPFITARAWPKRLTGFFRSRRSTT